MRKKLFSVILAVAMVASLAACGSKAVNDGDKGVDSGTQSNPGQDAEKEGDEEIVNITLTFPVLTSIPEDLGKVQEAMSQIALEECNCTITLQPLGFADYMTQAPLMLSGGEDIGLLAHFNPITVYPSMVEKGQIQDITTLLEEQVPEVLEIVGEDYLAASRINGSLYGVPTMHERANGSGFIMRTDLLEKYSIDVSQVKTMDDLDAIFEVIKENEPDISPTYMGGASMNPADIMVKGSVDELGDGFGVLMNRGQDATVTDYFESDEYRNYVEKVYEWNQKGYILPDSDSIQDMYTTLLQANKVFSVFMTNAPGSIEQDERNTGLDLTFVQLGAPLSTTTTVNGIQWVVPIGAKHPEKSVDIIRLLYTNADFLNLFNYGIEGEHYVAEGNNQISRPDGMTEETSPYNWSIAYLTGNEFLCYTWDIDNPNLWKEVKEWNDNVEKSSAMGFSFDNSNVTNEITAISNVCNQYRIGLENGVLDPEVYMEKFIADLKTAGIDTVIAEKQSQLDAWKAAQ
ncbi:MAG: extracellular solute-binding protein [Lachnospiraceae bacterium]|nr:extracellular solute-binding protein [Lachnospiraceae bacterium]